jgi:type II secretory pathway component PulL
MSNSVNLYYDFNASKQIYAYHLNRFEPIQSVSLKKNDDNILWINSDAISFHTVSLPPKLTSDFIANAIYFELEEIILQDLSQFHIVYHKIEKDKVAVAMLPKKLVKEVVDICEENNIDVSAIFPIVFVLPWDVASKDNDESNNVWMALIHNEAIILRDSQYSGFISNISNSELINYEVKNKEASLKIIAPSNVEIPKCFDGYSVQNSSLETIFSLLVKSDCKFNFLQGEFKPKWAGYEHLKEYSGLLKKSMFVLAFLFLNSVVSYMNQQKEISVLQQNIEINAKSLFSNPEKQRNWKKYVYKYAEYFGALKNPNLPWVKFKSIGVYLNLCKSCKIDKLQISKKTISVTLSAIKRQDNFYSKLKLAKGLSVNYILDKGKHSYIIGEKGE